MLFRFGIVSVQTADGHGGAVHVSELQIDFMIELFETILFCDSY